MSSVAGKELEEFRLLEEAEAAGELTIQRNLAQTPSSASSVSDEDEDDYSIL